MAYSSINLSLHWLYLIPATTSLYVYFFYLTTTCTTNSNAANSTAGDYNATNQSTSYNSSHNATDTTQQHWRG